ncbi:MAG: antibiotic biosynthesis monooxygenase family protein [Deferrisomatales bacterium]
MSIRVLMTRRVPRLTGGLDVALLPKLSEMLDDLRTMAHRQPGYISGETLRNVEDPSEYLVISTWKSVEDWKRWFGKEQRAELEGRVDALLGSSTVYKVYSYD